jgi:excisionase family DNA binding protein
LAIVDAVREAVRAELGAALRSAPAATEPEFFTVRETMTVLAMSRTQLYRAVVAGHLVITKRGRRSLLSATAVRQYAEQLRAGEGKT